MPGRRTNRIISVAAVLAGLAAVLGGIALAGVWSEDTGCTPEPEHPEWSIARQWNEALLEAIRRDVPAPTVHARNLFHTSAAMWDAWAAYGDDASGVLVEETQSASDVEAARGEAISYAAFRVLEARYIDSIGAVDTIPQFDALMESLCYPIDETSTEGDAPAAVGNRIGEAILAHGLTDGSNEAEGYAAPDYSSVNPPLVVAESGTVMADPNRWQPLQLEQMISQNGIPVANESQEFIDPHWGNVTGFALPPAGADAMPVDPGPPPLIGDAATDQAFKDAAVEVVRLSSLLDPTTGRTIDISPASLGANPLGTNDGAGRETNPITGAAYGQNLVNEADFGRVVAEFWADGPNSETPPGHWNTLANAVSDELEPELMIGGVGPAVDRLEWDVKLYLALNGANHDAAVAAWGTKGHYDYVRPISMIRYMGGLGQSSDPAAPSFHPEGLLLVPGLVEVVTAETAMPGARHSDLAPYEGEVAILAYRGTPDDPENGVGGVGWIRAVDWAPYQAPTFVTPSFAGYVSGHSTFSRASAEVLAGFTGSEFFPGGLGEWAIPAGSLEFDRGPQDDVNLQWATYADAADQAGLSRLYGGIHVSADDLAGRTMGASIGQAAWELARQHYGAMPEGDA